MVVISGIRAEGRSGAPSVNERFAVSFISAPVGQTFLRQGKRMVTTTGL